MRIPVRWLTPAERTEDSTYILLPLGRLHEIVCDHKYYPGQQWPESPNTDHPQTPPVRLLTAPQGQPQPGHAARSSHMPRPHHKPITTPPSTYPSPIQTPITSNPLPPRPPGHPPATPQNLPPNTPGPYTPRLPTSQASPPMPLAVLGENSGLGIQWSPTVTLCRGRSDEGRYNQYPARDG